MADLRNVSIVVPVHGQSVFTRNLLERLVLDAETKDVEIVVVDDASPDDTKTVLAAFGDRVRTVAFDRNRGFASACNAGAHAASGDVIVFLNNDIVPTPGWLGALSEHAAAHDQAAVVGAKLLFPNDTVQHAGVVICQDLLPRHVYSGFPADHPAVSKSRRFQVVTGGCALMRRDVFETLGGFDEAYLNSYEDVDLCLRAGEAGYEVRYCATSVLYHFESQSRRGSPGPDPNRERLLERWSTRLVPDEFATYAEDGLLEVEYRSNYPLHFRISPLLATIDWDDRDGIADRLLAERAALTLRLLRENIRLRARLGEIPDVQA